MNGFTRLSLALLLLSAIEEANEAVRLDRKSNSAQATLGYVYAAAGDFAKAEQILEDLTKADKRLAVPPLYLSFIYAGLGRNRRLWTASSGPRGRTPC